MNTAIMIGHITRDAITRTVNVKGTSVLVTDFTVAVNEGYGDTQRTEYVKCSMWRDRGAKLAQYLTKGRAVTIKGAVSCQAWIATQGDNAGKAMCQLVMSNPAVELIGKNNNGPADEDIPFVPDEEYDV